jgi:predicted  nucleic acid-binding Zn-ribbon protein
MDELLTVKEDKLIMIEKEKKQLNTEIEELKQKVKKTDEIEQKFAELDNKYFLEVTKIKEEMEKIVKQTFMRKTNNRSMDFGFSPMETPDVCMQH